LHSDWCEMGLNSERFWNLCPVEVLREIEAAVKKQIRQRNELAWLAWHTAKLHRVNKMPKLKTLMIEIADKKKKKISWQEQFNKVMAWAERKKK